MISPPDLSFEQRTAVQSDARAIVVVASAGSGKTEVVARRIGLPVDLEVITRLEDRAELFARWLIGNGQTLPEDLEDALRQIDLSRAKQEPISDLQREWDAALSDAGAVDYGSMLTRTEELLKLPFSHHQISRLYHHVIVDESQNLTPAQYSLLIALIGPPPGNNRDHIQTMLVGDEKQSLVGFAGADSRLIHRFECDYHAARIELTNNFRSAQNVVAIGERVSKELNHSLSLVLQLPIRLKD